jgi:hypothetical protein
LHLADLVLLGQDDVERQGTNLLVGAAITDNQGHLDGLNMVR